VGVAVTNLSVYLTESANRYPDASALRCDDATTTYSVLASDVARFADYVIDGGLQPGDRVGVMLPSGPAFAVVFYGVLHAGGVVVPMNPALRARAVEFCLTITDARMLFVTPRRGVATTVAAVTAGAQPVKVGKHGIAQLTAGFPGRADPVSPAAGDTAVVLPISKTTGAHGVRLTHSELASSQAVTARRLTLGPNEVVMGCLPLFEGFGMTCGLLAAMSAGATLVLLRSGPRIDPATALETIAAERITVFEGAPAMYAAMLEAADGFDGDFTSLRVCVSAGSPLPVDILRRFEDRFGCVVVQGDGLLQTSPTVRFHHPDAVHEVGSIGTPIDGVRMRPVDES
jgi:long-chain acyl-CoA synthetase